MFEFTCAEWLQVEEIDHQIEDLLKVAEAVGPNIGVLFEESLHLRRSGPIVIFVLCKNEDVVPDCLNYHFGVVYQL